MKIFLRAAAVDEVTTPYKLIKLDLQKKDSKLKKATEVLSA